ncbi:RDD family protein [Microbacterium sp. P01]|uniref:RDD family protein n=1 Tax=Microbacterium sp. P01 TaxID=3366261 RepID=UPI003671C19E
MPEDTAPPAPSAPTRPQLIDVQQDEVLTGEAVALDVQPVGFFLRALGTLIDMVVAAALFLLFVPVLTALLAQGAIDETVLPILSIAMLVTVTVIVPTAVETATRGRSLGKLAVGARIVRADGGASGFRQSFIRALTGVFELWFTVGAVAALVGAFTPRSQRLGDLLAGTYSERTRAPELPAPPLPVPPALAGWAMTADVARLPDPLARRIAQFSQQAGHLQPPARARIATSLASEAAAFVSPRPDVDAETLLIAVMAVRRDRELHALLLQNQRVEALTSGATRGFPDR